MSCVQTVCILVRFAERGAQLELLYHVLRSDCSTLILLLFGLKHLKQYEEISIRVCAGHLNHIKLLT